MYVQRVVFSPAQGKGAELRAALTERVSVEHQLGRAVTLGVRLFPGAAGPSFSITIRHQDLAAAETFRRQNAADEGFQAFMARVATLTSAPLDVRLSQILMPFPAAAPAPQAGSFVQSAWWYPTVGANPELQPLLEERVKGLQANGRPAALWSSVYDSDFPLFTVLIRFPNLAELDSQRSRDAADPAFQAFVARATRQVRQPTEVRLTELLVPSPS